MACFAWMYAGTLTHDHLLLRLRDLVDRGRLDIRDLRLSGFLRWLWPLARRQDEASLGDLCSVLETAARLVLLKARRITGEWTIQAVAEAAPWLGHPPDLPLRRSWLAGRIAGGPFSFGGPARAFEGVAPQLVSIAPEALRSALARVLARQAPPTAVDSPSRPRTSVEHATQLLLAALDRDGEVSFTHVAGATRDERIASFLACLTLARQGRVALSQEELFGEIRVRSATAALEATA